MSGGQHCIDLEECFRTRFFGNEGVEVAIWEFGNILHIASVEVCSYTLPPFYREDGVGHRRP